VALLAGGVRRRAYAIRRLLVRRLDLLSNSLLLLTRLGRLLRLGGRSARRGGAGLGEPAAGEHGAEPGEHQNALHDPQFTRPACVRKGSAERGTMALMSRLTGKPQRAEEPRVRRGYFESRYGQLHVHNAIPPGGGFEEGTALICVHGAQGTGRTFRGFLALVGRDRSVYAPDLPGYGESDGPPQALSAAEYAAAIGDFLDTMRLRQVDLLAHGAGSVLATELALTRAPQVRRLVLVSVPLGPAGLQAGSTPAGGLAAAAAGYALRERLGRVSQPLLVLRPRDEWWDATARVREAQPAARLVDIPDHGPDLFQASPGAVVDAMRAFLRG